MTRKKRASKILLVVIIVLIVLAALIAISLSYDSIMKLQYPLEYEDIIVDYSEYYGLDPYFVCAVIDTESSFDVNANSRVGAQGLMQLMPETADWIAGKLGLDSYDAYDAETNIAFGCWYLDYLFDNFSSKEVVLAAYNAGPNKVKQWLDDPQYSSDGVYLNNIPYEETENYVNKVLNAYEKYVELYEIN